MAVCKEDIIDINLETGNTHRSYTHHILGEFDEAGDVFGVRLIKGGRIADLTGVSCTGLFEKPDGTTEPILGYIEKGAGCVKLPADCYSEVGAFKLTIKLVSLGEVVTARIVDGTIVDTSDGPLIDPTTGTAIPDMEGLEDLLETLEGILAEIAQYNMEAVQITGTRYRIEITEGS